MNKTEKLKILTETIAGCKLCPAFSDRTQIVMHDGNPDASIALLGEAPGRNEDESGVPFCGRAGQLLDNILRSLGLSRESVYILNICKCRPPNNRTPLPEEAENCRQFLDLQLKIVAPKKIVCLGACATQNLLRTKSSISSLRGQVFQIETPIQAAVVPTWHPAYALRTPAAN